MRHGETYTHTWRPTIAGLQWLGDMVRLIWVLGLLWLLGLPWLERVERPVRELGDLWLQEVR